MDTRVIAFLLIILAFLAPNASAQDKPFILPVAEPPGPSTWMMGQPYGNTTGAYLRGDEWYRAGQRLHFGIDLSMPCGTPLVAIGDGEVVGVSDLSFGSAPHNLLIRHDAGYVSLYGHLLERPQFVPGMRVTQGQQVGLSGDPDISCDSRPHLHLEIRSLDYRTTYNPISLINADWHALAAVGSFRYPLFQQDLDNARRWISLDDQPDVAFGGEALNRYAATFPQLERIFAAPNPPLAGQQPLSSAVSWRARPLAFSGCCANAAWHPTDPLLLYMIDGAPNTRALLYEWDVAQAGPTGMVTTAPPPLRSADGTHEITIAGDAAVIRRASDSATWELVTGGSVPTLSTDNRWALYTTSSEIAAPGEDGPRTRVTLTSLDGTDARMLADASGVSAQWLNDTRVLLSQRSRTTTNLYYYDLTTGETIGLAAFEYLRGLSVAPGGGRVAFYLAYQGAASEGVYTLEMAPGATAVQHPWFGTFRWRSADQLLYIPFAPGQPQQLRLYDVATGEDAALTDLSSTSFAIANGDWSVSADGMRVAFWNAADLTTWLLEPSS